MELHPSFRYLLAAFLALVCAACASRDPKPLKIADLDHLQATQDCQLGSPSEGLVAEPIK